MIPQIRHLQSQEPFETFSIELASGRVIQIYDRYSVATQYGNRPSEAKIGVLHGNGSFELVNVAQITSVSVGVHPEVKERLDRQMEWAKKTYGGEEAS